MVPLNVNVGGREVIIQVSLKEMEYLKNTNFSKENKQAFLEAIGRNMGIWEYDEASTKRNTPNEENTPANVTANNTTTKKPHQDENPEVEKIVYKHHEFEKRTKGLLTTESKKFMQACCNLVVQLDRERSTYEVRKQYGDKLLNDTQTFYQRVELAREYCLEALDEQERLEDKYAKYMQIMFNNLCTCEEVHRMYFEQQEKNRILRQQQIQSSLSQSQIQPQHTPCQAEEPLIKPEQEAWPGIQGISPNIPEKMTSILNHPSPSLDPRIPTTTKTLVIDSHQDQTRLKFNKLGIIEKLDGSQTKKHNTCIFCNKTMHRYQLNCAKLKNMTPNQIYKVMTTSGIKCKMWLEHGHRTKNCPATNKDPLKKCHIKEDGKECQKYHCRYLHKYK